MLSRPQRAALPPRTTHATPPAGVDPDTALLQLAGEVSGEPALIIGANAPKLKCALIRRGAAEVSLLREGVRPERATADLAVTTEIGSPEQALSAMAHARRALAASTGYNSP